MSASDVRSRGLCHEVEERFSEVLDGSAPATLFEHIADCDECRDRRHEVSLAATTIAGAGADSRPATDFAQKVLERVLMTCAAPQAAAPPVQPAVSSGAEVLAGSSRAEMNAEKQSEELSAAAGRNVLAELSESAKTQPSPGSSFSGHEGERQGGDTIAAPNHRPKAAALMLTDETRGAMKMIPSASDSTPLISHLRGETGASEHGREATSPSYPVPAMAPARAKAKANLMSVKTSTRLKILPPLRRRVVVRVSSGHSLLPLQSGSS